MDLGQWKGLFEWSMKFQDGTKPTSYDPAGWTPEKKKWLEEVMQAYMKDFGERMKEIKDVLDSNTSTPASLQEKEALLEELMSIVESIDFARDLHTVGGLSTLLDLLQSPHPSLRWRAAEVVSTCVQNNPPVQEWFMQGGALPPLLTLVQDNDPTCSSKGLLAVSSLIRHFPAAIGGFRRAGGVALLTSLLGAKDARVQKKAMSTLHYMLSQVPQDSEAVCRQGAVAPLVDAISSDDCSMKEAALKALVELAAQPSCSTYLCKDTSLGQTLTKLEQHHHQLDEEDRDAQQEEIELRQQLQSMLQHQAADSCAPVLQHAQAGASGSSMGGRLVGIAGGNSLNDAEQLQHDRSYGLMPIDPSS